MSLLLSFPTYAHLLDVVVGQGAAIFKLLSSKDQTLLVRGNSLLVLDLALDIVDGVARLDLERDGLAGECLYEAARYPLVFEISRWAFSVALALGVGPTSALSRLLAGVSRHPHIRIYVLLPVSSYSDVAVLGG